MSTPEAIAQLFQALADPTRVSLLQAVRKGRPTATDLHTALGMSQPRVARHLKILVEAGLLVGRREGRFVRYSLPGTGIEARIAEAALAGLATGGAPSAVTPFHRVATGARPASAVAPPPPPPPGEEEPVTEVPVTELPGDEEAPGGGMEDFLL